MTTSLDFDAAAVGSAADRLLTASSNLPQANPLSIDDCGSASVAAAADGLALWLRITAENGRARLSTASLDARAAASAFEQVDTSSSTAVRAGHGRASVL